VVIVSGGGGGALEGGGPVLVAGFEGASEFSTGDSGVGRSMGQLGPGVRGKAGDPVAIAPGIEVPIGDPYQSYPAGREQAGMINLASLTAAGSRGAEVRVPEWASSYSGDRWGGRGQPLSPVHAGDGAHRRDHDGRCGGGLGGGAGVRVQPGGGVSGRGDLRF